MIEKVVEDEKGRSVKVKTEYIQLPPLSSDVPPIFVQMIWLYARMPGQEQELLLKFMEENLNKDAGRLDETKFSKILDDSGVELNPNVIEYNDLMGKMIGGLIVQACELASLVYQSHCIEGKSVEEIEKEFDLEEKLIRLIAEYYDKRSKQDEVD